jgi:hypothetical protein
MSIDRALHAVKPDLDDWLPDPTLRVQHSRHGTVAAAPLWQAAAAVRLNDAALLGRLVRWRIPGLARDVTFDALFREPPFMVLAESEHALVSGLVGRIWTLRRDYPELSSPQAFRDWTEHGSARVVIASWALDGPGGGATLFSEARVQGLGSRGRVGVAAVRPLVRAFAPLVGSEGIIAAIRRAERDA